MAKKPTYEELEQRISELEKESAERKRAEEALRSEKNKLQALMDGLARTQIGIDIVGTDYKVLFQNQTLQERFGDLTGEICYEKYMGLEKPCDFCPMIKAIKSNKVESVQLTGADGRNYELFSASLPNPDGTVDSAIEIILDITAQAKAEEALHQSEERYRGLVENSFDGIFVQKGPKIIFTNQRLNEMLGYDEGELVGLDHWLVYHPDYQKITRERAQARMRGEKVTHQYEVKLQRKDGSWFYGEINARAISLEEEHGIQVWVRNITERKKAEEELKTRRLYLESVLYSAPDAIVTLDSSHHVLEWNIGAEKIFGYTRHEATGKNLDDLITGPDVIDESKEFTTQVLSGGKVLPRGTVRYRKDGTPVNVIVAGSPIIIRDEFQGVVAVYTDITSRKQAEEALKESEEKYRTILESIEDGYYEVDIAGNFTFFNDSICKMLGYTNDELMGMNNREYTKKESAKRLYQTFNRVYKTGKPAKIFDWEIGRKDATKRHVETSISLMKDSEGNPAGFRGIVRDITEKKLLESQLLQAQKMEAIGTLAGGIAHNFNNLLMGIQGNTSLMLLDTSPDHPHYERLTNIEKSVQSGSKLTSQLLGYARGGRYEVKPISINHIITDTSSTFSMTRKDITLHHDLANNLTGVKADFGQIEQVILNIYVNAAEAMVGVGELFITTRNISHTDIKKKSYATKPGNYILLTIRDTGTGMDKATQVKIFDPFFTTKGLAKGTGLGLASVYGIIKAHGGYIDVESQKGKGTTFFIYLPASTETIGEEVQPAGTIEKGKETILLVDDEEMILDVGEALLTSLGYTVLIAHGGKEALERVSKSHGAKRREHKEKERYVSGTLPFAIDLVILDMIMPSMGGGETYDRMKELYPNIKVLLSSGYSIDGQAKEILKRGCDGFIQKPFTIKELSNAIRGVLGEG